MFHRVDLRNAVNDPEKDIVILEGDTFVRAQGLRPFGPAGHLAILVSAFQQRLAKEASRLWGRLNSRKYKCPDTGDVLAPYQMVEQWGVIAGLRRRSERIGGYRCARGRFSPLEGEVTSPWMSETEINAVLGELYRKTDITTVVGGRLTITDGVSAIEQENEKLQIELSVASLKEFLAEVAARQARQRSTHPLKPFGDLITLLHALDPGAVECAADELLVVQKVNAQALLRLLPGDAQLKEIVELRHIIKERDIEIDTVRRRMRKCNLRTVKTRGRQTALLRKDYERYEHMFKPLR